MNIYVCIKQVPDTETKIRVKPDANGIETSDVKWILNPYDEFAVEEAIKTRDKLADGSIVTVVTLGPKQRAQEALRTALAMGCDNATIIDTAEVTDTATTAKALSVLLKTEKADLIFMGKQAIDDDCSQVPQLVAAALEIPHCSLAIKFELSSDKTKAVVEREVEGGTKEIHELSLPCVVGANKGLNSPRYASLPGIMKAKKKEIKEVSLTTLGVADGDARITLTDFKLPPPRPAGKILESGAVESTATLAKLLREEAKVI